MASTCCFTARWKAFKVERALFHPTKETLASAQTQGLCIADIEDIEQMTIGTPSGPHREVGLPALARSAEGGRRPPLIPWQWGEVD